jgi:hypothetical protein
MEMLQLIKQAAPEANEASDPMKLYYGEVTATSPLQILVNASFTITEDFIILTRNVTDYKTTITFADVTSAVTENTTVKTSHKHNVQEQKINADLSVTISDKSYKTDGTITVPAQSTEETEFNAQHNHKYIGEKEVTINNHLKVGDKVILLRDKGGQKYLVLDRIGEI